jgi:hypothetical protein
MSDFLEYHDGRWNWGHTSTITATTTTAMLLTNLLETIEGEEGGGVVDPTSPPYLICLVDMMPTNLAINSLKFPHALRPMKALKTQLCLRTR